MPLANSQLEESFASNDECIQSLLSNILILNLQSQTSEKTVISSINKLLSVSKTRFQGMEYLNLLINNCSNGIIFDNAVNWINHCLVKYPGDNLKEIKLTTIGKIIDIAHRDPEFTKKFVSEYIGKVLEMCLSPHVNRHEVEAALETLTKCMKAYASWFTSHKVKIESFLVKFLDNSSDSIVDKAAIAFHYLQQVGGAGVDGINHITNFSTSFQKLCVTVHNLFDKFFENETEFDQYTRGVSEGFSFSDTSLDSQKSLHVTAARIRNCVKFIRTMMLKGFPVAREIKPIEVLDIISRGTMIHHCLGSSDVENTLADFQFSLLLNDIQIQLLQLLRVTLIWFQRNILPFSFVISKILTDCLKKCQNCKCFSYNCLYQETVYKVLSQWIRLAKCSLHPHFQSQVITFILKDVTPAKSNLTLSINDDSEKHKSKKAKRRAVQDRIISSGLETNNLNKTSAEKFSEEKACSLALDTLHHLLNASFLNIETGLLKDLYKSIIGTLLEINSSKLPHPYTNPECQANLYQVLGSFYEQDTLHILPPLQLTLGILTKGANKSDRFIAATCQKSLSMLEKLCQPVCPSLYAPGMFLTQHTDDNIQNERLFDEQVLKKLDARTQKASKDSQEMWCAKDSAKKDTKEGPAEDSLVPKIKIQDVKVVVRSTEDVIKASENVTDNSVCIDNAEIHFEKELLNNDDIVMNNVSSVANEEQIPQNEGGTSNLEQEEVTSIDIRHKEVSSSDICQREVGSSDICQREVGSSDICQREVGSSDICKRDVVSSDMCQREVGSSAIRQKDEKISELGEVAVVESQETVSIRNNEEVYYEGEPPVKKSRSETEVIVETEPIKEEVQSCEEADDVFNEEDSFVDVVKDY